MSWWVLQSGGVGSGEMEVQCRKEHGLKGSKTEHMASAVQFLLTVYTYTRSRYTLVPYSLHYTTQQVHLQRLG